MCEFCWRLEVSEVVDVVDGCGGPVIFTVNMSLMIGKFDFRRFMIFFCMLVAVLCWMAAVVLAHWLFISSDNNLIKIFMIFLQL